MSDKYKSNNFIYLFLIDDIFRGKKSIIEENDIFA